MPKEEQSRQKVVKSFATGAFVIEEDLQLTLTASYNLTSCNLFPIKDFLNYDFRILKKVVDSGKTCGRANMGSVLPKMIEVSVVTDSHLQVRPSISVLLSIKRCHSVDRVNLSTSG